MTEKPVSNQPTFSWLASWRVYLEAASLRMLFLGFAAGLPLLLVLGTLSFRLREAGIDRSTIGYLSWVGLADTTEKMRNHPRVREAYLGA